MLNVWNPAGERSKGVHVTALDDGIQVIVRDSAMTGLLATCAFVIIGVFLWELPIQVPVITWPTLLMSCVAAFWLFRRETKILTNRPTDTLHLCRRFRFKQKGYTRTVRMSSVRKVSFGQTPFGWDVALDLGDEQLALTSVPNRRALGPLVDSLRRELGTEAKESEDYSVADEPDQLVITMIGCYDKPKRLLIDKAVHGLTVDGRVVRSVAAVWLRPYTYEGSYHRWQVGIDGTGTWLHEALGMIKEQVVANGVREEAMKSLAEILAGSLAVGFGRRALYKDSGTW